MSLLPLPLKSIVGYEWEKKQPLNFSIGPSSYRIDSYRINNPVEKLALGEVYIIGVSSIVVKGILNFFDI